MKKMFAFSLLFIFSLAHAECIKHQGDVNIWAPGNFGKSPVSESTASAVEAIKRGDTTKFKDLLDHGLDCEANLRYADIGDARRWEWRDTNLTLLSFAIVSGKTDIANLMIESGADLNWQEAIADRCDNYFTFEANPLIFAIVVDDSKIIETIARRDHTLSVPESQRDALEAAIEMTTREYPLLHSECHPLTPFPIGGALGIRALVNAYRAYNIPVNDQELERLIARSVNVAEREKRDFLVSIFESGFGERVRSTSAYKKLLEINSDRENNFKAAFSDELRNFLKLNESDDLVSSPLS